MRLKKHEKKPIKNKDTDEPEVPHESDNYIKKLELQHLILKKILNEKLQPKNSNTANQDRPDQINKRLN